MPYPLNRPSTNTYQSGKVGCLGIIGLLLLTVVITIAGTVWAIQSQFFTRDFSPVELTDKEQLTLEQKLNALGGTEGSSTPDIAANSEEQLTSSAASGDTAPDDIAREINVDEYTLNNDNAESRSASEATIDGEIQPELYIEDDSKRRIELTERELNALLAKNTDLAEQLVVDLTDNLASIKLLVDVDPDFPFLGGKTLKVSGGTELSYQNNRPVIVMKGVSVWGVPIPNAWLGGLKNIDLVSEFGGTDGFWKSLADGIEDIRVEDSKLLIQLAE